MVNLAPRPHPRKAKPTASERKKRRLRAAPPWQVAAEYVAELLNDSRRVLGNGWLWRERWVRWVPDVGEVLGAEGWVAAEREVDRYTVGKALADRSYGLAVRDVVEASWFELDVDCHDEPWDPAWTDAGLEPARGRARRRLNAELARDRVAAVLEATPGVPWLLLASPRGFRMRVRFARAWPIVRVEALGAALLAKLGLPNVEAFPRRNCSGRLGYSLGLAPVKADLVSGVGGGAVAWMVAEMTGPKVGITELERLAGIPPKRAAGRRPSTRHERPKKPRKGCKTHLGGRVCVVEGCAGGAPGGVEDQLFGADFAAAVLGILRGDVPHGLGYACAWKLMFATACARLADWESMAVAEVVADRAGMDANRRKRWLRKCADRLARANEGLASGAIVARLRNPAVLAELGRALGREVEGVEEVAVAARGGRLPASAGRVAMVRRAAARKRWEARDAALEAACGGLFRWASVEVPGPRRKRIRPKKPVVGARLQAMTSPWNTAAAARRPQKPSSDSFPSTAGLASKLPTASRQSATTKRLGSSSPPRAGPAFDTS